MSFVVPPPDLELVMMRTEHVDPLYRLYLEDPYAVSPGVVNGRDWLAKVAQDEDQFRFALTSGGHPVGALVFCWSHYRFGTMSPTMWIAMTHRRKGHGLALLRDGWGRVLLESPMARKLLAQVCGHNTASLALCARFFGAEEARIPNQVFHDGRWWPMVYFGKYR